MDLSFSRLIIDFTHTQVRHVFRFCLLALWLRTQYETDNPLQTAVLNLFASLKSRFPNLVVGSITRDSVKKALANGISADQVFLSLKLSRNV